MVRLRNIYRGFQRRWGDVAVLTCANRRRFEQDESLAVDAKIEEVPAWDLRRLLASRSREKRMYRPVTRKNGKFQQWAGKLVDSFPFNVLISFGGPLYLWLGYRRAARLVEERKITHLLSSYRPFADHLIAWWLKGRYPHLHWIADFRDLPVDTFRQNTLFPAFQHRIQRYLLRRADWVTTVSEGLATELRAYHPSIRVLRNGIDPDLLQIPEATPPSPVHFTINYTGSIYPGQQSARPLLKALARLVKKGAIPAKQLRLEYAGKDGDVWRQWVREAAPAVPAVDHGMRSWREAARLQRSAHINLLLSWSPPTGGGILTAKIFEYLAARRPILALIEGGRDKEWDDLFKTIPHCRIFYPQLEVPGSMESYLLEQYRRWKSGVPTPQIDESVLQPFTWPALIDPFIDELEKT